MEKTVQTTENKMGTMPVNRLLLSMSIPMVISMLIQALYNIVDSIFVARIGEDALTAVSLAFPLQNLMIAVASGTGVGVNALLSKSLGAKDFKLANRTANVSVFLALMNWLVFIVFGIFFTDIYFRAQTDIEVIINYGNSYLRIVSIISIGVFGQIMGERLLQATGKTFYTMITQGVGAIINIIFDPIFMFVFGWGVAGAGIATGLSQMISFLILLFMFLSGKTESKLSIKLVTKNISEVMSIVLCGFPSLIRQGLSSFSTMALNHQAALYGDAAVAAMSIVNRISMFIFSVGLGIGQGFQPVAGFNYGAEKYSRVKKGFWFTVSFGEAMLGCFAIVGLIVSQDIIGWFRDDPAVVDVGIFALQCQCVACFFQPLSVCSNMLFQSVGKSGRASFLSSLRSGLFFIPLIIILPRVLGLTGIQVAQPISDVLAFIISVPMVLAFLRSLPKDAVKNSLDETIETENLPEKA